LRQSGYIQGLDELEDGDVNPVKVDRRMLHSSDSVLEVVRTTLNALRARNRINSESLSVGEMRRES